MVFISRSKRNRERIVINNTEHEKVPSSIKVSANLHTNIHQLHKLFDKPGDLKTRTLTFGDTAIEGTVVFFEGIVDPIAIQQSVLNNLETAKNYPDNHQELFQFIYQKYIAINDVQTVQSFDDLTQKLLSGFTIIFIDGVKEALMIQTIGGEFRAIEEPITETLIRGPRSGFVENLETNLALIRRRAKDPNLRFQTYTVGARSNTQIVVAYIKDIMHPEVLQEVNRRLETIDIDAVPESGYVEEWIEDSFLSPFPQILNTERPDKAISALMQGKFVIIVEGTPFVLIAPINFSTVLQSQEDYYERWTIGSLLRLLRYAAAFIALFLPAIYVALISIQPALLPTDLVFSIAGSREGVPFPPIIEALLMVITMELLQEAGACLPQTIGQTVGIVGGLVIGEAAVQAGIVSPIMVIVIAITAISTFAIPSYSVAIAFRIVRFAFIFAAGIFGLYGIILIYIMINIHFVNLKSFGIPYSSSFAPFFYSSDWNDVVLRAPLQTGKKRPEFTSTIDDISLNDKGETE